MCAQDYIGIDVFAEPPHPTVVDDLEARRRIGSRLVEEQLDPTRDRSRTRLTRGRSYFATAELERRAVHSWRGPTRADRSEREALRSDSPRDRVSSE